MSSTILIPNNQPEQPKVPYWLLTVVIACLIPLVTNVLLPMLGIQTLSQRLGPTTLPTVICAILGGLLYLQYLRLCMKHPLVLAIYSGSLIWPVQYLGLALETVGIIFPIRVMHFGLLVIPAMLMLLQNFKYLNRNYPYFKFIVLFISLFSLYFLFYNYNFVEPVIALRSGASISSVKLHDVFYSFVGMTYVACAFRQAKTAEERFKLFRLINLCIIIFILIQAVATIIGYPFSQLTTVLEGFKRSTGFTYHPNEFAKVEGLWLLYFIGIYYYYGQLENKALIKDRLLIGVSVVINILAFLLSMSKNSFGSFGVGCVIFFGLSLFDAKLRSKILMPILFLAGLLLLAVIGYQVFSGSDLMATLSDRFNDTRSLEWRYSVWGFLLGNMDQHSIWIGHGLTSSNIELYRFLFDPSKESKGQSIFVHNAFINFLYDMGISGLCIFSGFIVTAYQSFMIYLRTHNALFLAMVSMTVFSLISSCVDECITEINVSLLFWFLITLAFSNFLKEQEVSKPVSNSMNASLN